MNNFEKQASFYLLESDSTQRQLTFLMHCSLGTVNKTLKQLQNQEFLRVDNTPSRALRDIVISSQQKNAVILAAGFGMRSVPINVTTPKALIEVNGERVIERQIRFLHEANVTNITIVVGFMKERFEYLIDKYGVQLVFNEDYKLFNNIWSVNKAIDQFNHTYLIPGDIWLKKNPFSINDFYSWYMVSEEPDNTSTLRIGKQWDFQLATRTEFGRRMIGITYMTKDVSELFEAILTAHIADSSWRQKYWESVLMDEHFLIGEFVPRMVSSADAVDLNTYEDLRIIDNDSDQLNQEAVHVISKTLRCEPEQIGQIVPLKKGMTNRSFSFAVNMRKYIMRIPGEGTEQLINRRNEAEVYSVVRDFPYIETVDYLNPENGYKISEYIDGAIGCDATNSDQVLKCMRILRELHALGIETDVRFDLYDKIEYYESLWGQQPSIFEDYRETKELVYRLRSYVVQHKNADVLCHIDANNDNFIFTNADGEEAIKLIDWEYAGQQDPLVDVAMFAIYAGYNRKQIDWLLTAYLSREAGHFERVLYYSYIAICGLLWSNWCQYKNNLGVEFGEYFMQQYRFAKEYSKLALHLIEAGEDDNE